MTEIYRLRPANDKTIEELLEPYFWFSRPSEYKDIEDANVFSFIENNESIKQSFIRLFGNYDKILEQSKFVGICCFTKILPEIYIWRRFPKGHNGIFIAYDKDIIEKHFKSTYGLDNCFKKIEYLSNPTLFDNFSNYDILWEETKKSKLYKSLREIEKDDKLRDELFLKMFTKLNETFSFQKELRIILGSRNIPDKSEDIIGYKIPIPKDAILGVYTQPQTPTKTINKIKKVNIEIHKLNKND